MDFVDANKLHSDRENIQCKTRLNLFIHLGDPLLRLANLMCNSKWCANDSSSILALVERGNYDG